ncbi:MAG TPA: ABC transporter substrate-binding protein [Acidimicrobiales bacterium]
MSTHPSRRLLVGLLTLLALIGAACSSSDDDNGVVAGGGDDTEAPAGGDFPVTVGELTFDTAPAAIVSLSATATEILFAISAGDQVIAVDDQSDFPEAALDVGTDLSGYTPNIEAIAAFEPDLVVAFFDDGTLEAGLTAIGIPFLLQESPATFDDAYGQIADLGIITGHVDEAAAVVASIRGDLADLVADAPSAEGLTYYHELDDIFYSATSTTFVGEVYSLFGLTNIADVADGADSGFPQLSAEFIIDTDPSLIFLADTECCGQNLETVRARPGWDSITAVQDGHVIELSDDIVSRWGPRLVDFARSIAEAIASVETAGA